MSSNDANAIPFFHIWIQHDFAFQQNIPQVAFGMAQEREVPFDDEFGCTNLKVEFVMQSGLAAW
jgi:hypothetical protein